MGDPRARYAIWQDDHIELKAYEYPVEKTVAKVLSLPVPEEVKHDLVHVLRTGTAP
jgi:protein phosphatase